MSCRIRVEVVGQSSRSELNTRRRKGKASMSDKGRNVTGGEGQTHKYAMLIQVENTADNGAMVIVPEIKHNAPLSGARERSMALAHLADSSQIEGL
jgi:hypothetical protein